MNSLRFRCELLKVMPGYQWTVHQTSRPESYQSATGTLSSGFNRLSTLSVIRTERDGEISYSVKSAPHGTKSPWEHVEEDHTLARALRKLQKHYERQAAHFRSLAECMQTGRKAREVHA